MNKKLTIHVLASDGSPLGVSEQSIHGLDGKIGVGGAELAILTLMAGWVKAGHDVTFYNNPQMGYSSSFKQAPINLFIPQEYRDILIIFRSPNRRAERAVAGKKVWFSTDQYTVGDFAEFSHHVHKIVTISPFHADYFLAKYGITNTITMDLPVRTWEYEKEITKVPYRMVFCSVPTRGLDILAKCYDRIKQEVPQATLSVTSDFRLWGVASPMNEQYVRKFLGKDGVKFYGAISRNDMIVEQLQAEVHPYSCTYEELFCYSSAECQVAGCYPITSSVGALATTNMGKQIHGDPHSNEWQEMFIREVVTSLQKRKEYQELAQENRQRAIERFSLDKILQEWDEKVFYG